MNELLDVKKVPAELTVRGACTRLLIFAGDLAIYATIASGALFLFGASCGLALCWVKLGWRVVKHLMPAGWL